MPFIIVFNILVCVLVALVLITILGCSIASRDYQRKQDEKSQQLLLKIEKVKSISYLVFVCVAVLMVIVNLIF